MTAEHEQETPQPETPEGETPEWDRLPDEHPAAKALAKANAEAEKYRLALKEREDAEKSEVERLQDNLSEARSTVTNTALEAARLRVALRKGLTESQAKRLVGDTVEELEADAVELLKDFAAPEPSTAPRRPQEQLRPGATPANEPIVENPLERDLREKLGIST